MFVIKGRTSVAVEFVAVNLFTAEAVVRYTNGYEYLYSNVNRAKLLNLMLNPNMSLGFWVNKNCKIARVRVTGYTKGHAYSCG